ncbi:8-oxoguanine glycosylase ogg1 [Microbotryomycetes sp. JL201]|nr:8-oxoguanine glycosylase ogg1 [Microbotryomycetes sp. JL201]
MHSVATPLRFLPLLPSELQLATVLKSGQAFRWARFDKVHATKPDDGGSGEQLKLEPGNASDLKDTNRASSSAIGAEEWAMGWNDRTVVLRQDAKGIHYRALYPLEPPHASYLADLEHDTTRQMLISYFQLDTPLAPLYAEWAARDSHFRRKIEREGDRLEGIRVLNQDPWETLVSFICSSNNNISRITLMVNRVCESLGAALPHPSSFDPSTVHTSSSLPAVANSTRRETSKSKSVLHAFPPPSALAPESTDPLLRQLGFGYRAPFIEWTANYLIDKAVELDMTPHEYLETLRRSNFKDERGLDAAREKLMEFKGVGRKVADCIALFSLGWTETVPVDTHVHQIAIRDYAFPSSKSTSMTPALHDKVGSKLQSLWGKHAGWAQQVLFFADLKPSVSPTSTPMKRSSGVAGSSTIKTEYELTSVVRNKFQEELDAVMNTPGAKRRRTAVVQVKQVVSESDDEVVDQKNVKSHSRRKGGYPSPAATIVTNKKRAIVKGKIV